MGYFDALHQYIKIISGDDQNQINLRGGTDHPADLTETGGGRGGTVSHGCLILSPIYFSTAVKNVLAFSV